MNRIIVHVDMDAFFASVEQLIHPEWKGLPVVVGANPREGKGRGVVSAASYEARKYGIHSALPIGQAYRLCPNAVFVSGSMHTYKEYSNKIFAVFNSFTPLVEPLSIDEAFLDMTGLGHFYKNLTDLGKSIKSEIKTETGLTASVGIAPVKSVAKIASDFKKPDGLVIVTPDNMDTFLKDLPIERLWGVGEKTGHVLLKMGIKTFGQLWEIPLSTLNHRFGKMGSHLYYISRGIDDRRVSKIEEVKSISNEFTFNMDCSDMESLKQILLGLSEQVAFRMRDKHVAAKTLVLKLRYADFKTITRNKSVDTPIHDSRQIFEYASLLLKKYYQQEKSVRLIGVGVSNLLSMKEGIQLSIFDQSDQKTDKVDQAMDEINKRFGKGKIKRAALLNLKKREDHVS